MTLLLMPVIVLAAVMARVVRYALLGPAAAMLLLGLAAWMRMRRR